MGWLPIVGLTGISILGGFLFATLTTASHGTMRLIHVLLFAPWTWCLLTVLRQHGRTPGGVVAEYTVILAIAAMTELMQHYFPHHDPEWKGFLASVLGMTIGREGFMLAGGGAAKAPVH